MNKKDLKTGMVVEYRNGDLRLVVGEDLVNSNGIKACNVNSYNDDLTYPNDCIGLKIVAVYNDFEKSKCLWKRVEFKKQDLKNGAVVKTREGKYYLKVDDALINLTTGRYLDFSRYSDNLTYEGMFADEFLIVEVDNVECDIHRAYMRYVQNDKSNFIKINED